MCVLSPLVPWSDMVPHRNSGPPRSSPADPARIVGIQAPTALHQRLPLHLINDPNLDLSMMGNDDGAERRDCSLRGGLPLMPSLTRPSIHRLLFLDPCTIRRVARVGPDSAS